MEKWFRFLYQKHFFSVCWKISDSFRVFLFTINIIILFSIFTASFISNYLELSKLLPRFFSYLLKFGFIALMSFVVVVNCWGCWEILKFVNWHIFFFSPHSLVVFFLSVEAVRKLRTEGKKTGIHLDFNLLEELSLLVKSFSEPAEIVGLPRQGVW